MHLRCFVAVLSRIGQAVHTFLLPATGGAAMQEALCMQTVSDLALHQAHHVRGRVEGGCNSASLQGLDLRRVQPADGAP